MTVPVAGHPNSPSESGELVGAVGAGLNAEWARLFQELTHGLNANIVVWEGGHTCRLSCRRSSANDRVGRDPMELQEMRRVSVGPNSSSASE